jgi:hypothetical protein
VHKISFFFSYKPFGSNAAISSSIFLFFVGPYQTDFHALKMNALRHGGVTIEDQALKRIGLRLRRVFLFIVLV